MFNDFETTVTVTEKGKIELLVPDAMPGDVVAIEVRKTSHSVWNQRIGAGLLTGPSLSNDSIRREAIYSPQSS